jgi:hypothetical protein
MPIDPTTGKEKRALTPPGLTRQPREEKPPVDEPPAPAPQAVQTKEGAREQQATDLAIRDFLERSGAPAPTSAPTRATLMTGKQHISEERDWAAQPPKDEWERLGKMNDDEFEKAIGRIPHGHDFLLHFAPVKADKNDLLKQLYGEEHVVYDQDKDLFIVREMNKETGEVTYMRSDESSWTMRDMEDMAGGLVASAPELAAYTGMWAFHASKAPQHPYTKLGLLALATSSAAAAETVGAVKDAAFRKWGIKTDVRTGEILGRRSINFAIGVPVGYGIGRLFGAGKFTKDELRAMEDINSMRPIEGLDFMLTDEVIAARGQIAAAELGITQTAAETSLAPGVVKTQATAGRFVERVPGTTSPMRAYQLERQRGLQTAQETLTGATDFPQLGRQLAKELSEGEHLLRHWSMGRSAEAFEAAERAVISVGGITKTPGKFDPNVIGDKLRFLMNQRKAVLADEVGVLYKSIEDDLATAGVGQFVQFKNMGKAINEWRATRVPKVTKTTKTTVPASTITSPAGTPAVPASTVSETTRVPVGKFGEADAQAQQWLALSSETHSLSEAQTMISHLGEIVQRSRTGVEGSTGFTGAALRKFQGAAKDDLNDAFNALAKQGKVGPDMAKRWAEANKAHASKLDVLNKSKLIQNILRSGQEGGSEVNAREILTSLVAGKGKTGDLKLIKELLGKGDFEQIRIGLLHDLVGLNAPIKVVNMTSSPLTLSSGKIVPLGETIELVNLTHLSKHVDRLDEAFLRELLNDPGGGKVQSFKFALETYNKSMRLQGSLGRTSGITADEWKAIVREFDVGSGSTAYKLMKDAIRAEKNRREKYLDVLGEDWLKGNFKAVQAHPELFVDEVILGESKRALNFTKEIFPYLTPELRDTVRNHTANRILGGAIDVLKTPIRQTASGQGGVLKPEQVVKAIYGSTARQKVIMGMFTPEERIIFRNIAEYMQVLARMEQLGGQAGRMAAETAIGTGSAKNMVSQWGLAKIVFSPAGQDLLSKGAADKGNLAWMLKIMFDQRSEAGRKMAAAGEGAVRREMPKRAGVSARAAMSLSEPSAKEINSLARSFFQVGLENRHGGFESLFGGHRNEAPTEPEIKEYLEQFGKGKKGK